LGLPKGELATAEGSLCEPEWERLRVAGAGLLKGRKSG
jgi:hypothetical protein